MTNLSKQWNLMRSTNAMLRVSSASNEAAIALTLLSKVKNTNLPKTSRERYRGQVVQGKKVLEEVRAAVQGEPKTKLRSEAYIVLDALSDRYLTSDEKDMSEKLGKAITITTEYLEGKQVDTEPAIDLLREVARVTSEKTGAMTIKAR